MTSKPITGSQSIHDHSPENLIQNNVTNILGGSGCEMCNTIMPAVCGCQPYASSLLAASETHDATDVFRKEPVQAAGHQLDPNNCVRVLHHQSPVCTPKGLPTYDGACSQQPGGQPMAPDVMEGLHLDHDSPPSQCRKRMREGKQLASNPYGQYGYVQTVDQPTVPAVMGDLHLDHSPPPSQPRKRGRPKKQKASNPYDPATPNAMEGFRTHNATASKQSRKRKEMSSDVVRPHVQDHDACDDVQEGVGWLPLHVREAGATLDGDPAIDVAFDGSYLRNTNRRKRRSCKPSTASVHQSTSGGDVHSTGEPSTPNTTETRVHTGDQPGVTENVGRQSQCRKRGGCAGQRHRRTVHRRALITRVHSGSHNSACNIDGESSSSTMQGVPPEYDDLGDCTERCCYCNAVFWRAEQLAGHRVADAPARYHTCCGGGKVLMQPDADPPQYIKDLLGQRPFMENMRRS